MASEGIRYDFTSTGADRLARDFVKTGDSAKLAARGARLCADALRLEESAGKAAADGLRKAERVSAMLAVTERELHKEIIGTAEALTGEAAAAELAANRQKELNRSMKDLKSALSCLTLPNSLSEKLTQPNS